jgi:hypothetical protein
VHENPPPESPLPLKVGSITWPDERGKRGKMEPRLVNPVGFAMEVEARLSERIAALEQRIRELELCADRQGATNVELGARIG